MSTRIIMNNGGFHTVEEDIKTVWQAMVDGAAGVWWHVAGGEHGWNPPDEDQPTIIIRATEISQAYEVDDTPNPLARKREAVLT